MRWPVFTSKRRLGVVAVSLLMVAAPAGRASSALETMDAEVTGLYERSQSAVIKIHAAGAAGLARAPFGPSQRVSSGFFIDSKGRFVTADTVVENATAIWIDWQGRPVPAKLLGRDPLTKLALLQLDTAEPTPHLPLGNSDDLRVGSMVVAIGFPYDMPSAPVVGFVAGLDISCGRRIFPVNQIRAGCRLSPGQGGGPLLNACGEVVGLVVAAHGRDQCYGLPINAVKKICADILTQGAPQHPWVGLDVSEHPVTTRSAGSPGWEVYIREVFSNTPAATAGFQDRDIVLRIATNEIHRSADVLNAMFYRHGGETLQITVVRDETTQEVKIVIGNRPAEPPPIVPVPVLPAPQLWPVMSTPQILPVSVTRQISTATQ